MLPEQIQQLSRTKNRQLASGQQIKPTGPFLRMPSLYFAYRVCILFVFCLPSLYFALLSQFVLCFMELVLFL